MGAAQRQIWLCAQPAQDRLYGTVETDTGEVSVAPNDNSSSIAFSDGVWHLLTLSRGGQIKLSVDGGAPPSSPG